MSRPLPLVVHLFGRPTVVDARGVALDFPPGKPLALLVHIACSEGWIDRDRIGAYFWPSAANSRHSVRQGLLDLRKALGVDLLPPRVRRASVRPGLLTTDAQELDTLRTQHHAERLHALVRGPFCDGLSFDHSPELAAWHGEVATRMRRMLVEATRRVAAALMLEGRTQDAGDLIRAVSRAGIPEPELRLMVLGRIGTLPREGEVVEGAAALVEALRLPAGDGRPTLVLAEGPASEVTRLVEGELVRRPGLARLDLPGGSEREQRRLTSDLLDRVADLPGGGGRSRGTVKFHAAWSMATGPFALDEGAEGALRDGLAAVLAERPLVITVPLDRAPLAIVDLTNRVLAGLSASGVVIVAHSPTAAHLSAPPAAAFAALAGTVTRVRLVP